MDAREPADTHIRTVDGRAVLFQYGLPVPSFDTHADRPAERAYVDLDAGWRFAFDPRDTGVGDGWAAPGFDDSGWRAAQVPLPWDLYGTEGFGGYDGRRYGRGTAFTDGPAWFRTRFTAPPGAHARICFLGVAYAARVYLNGAPVGEHEGGHTPFALDLTAHVGKARENVLAVRACRPPRGHDTALPPKPVDCWPYAGITRAVYVEATAAVTVVKLLTDARDGRLTVAAVVRNHGPEPAERLLTLDPGTGDPPAARTVTAAPGEVRVVTADLPIPAAAPWSPDDPRLYRLTARLTGGGTGTDGTGVTDGADSADGLSVRYGMRTVGVADGRLLLNGEPVFLKGLNWHEETPERGRSLRPGDYTDLLGTARDLGANLLRNSGYTRHPAFYDAADRHGVLVCDEPDNFWVGTDQQRLQRTYGLSAALTAAMVWNQTNHPSVALWSLHNESATGDRDVYRAWISDLRDVVKRLDPQRRPVTWASSTSWDPAFDLADVIGFNEYFGFFYGDDEDLGPTLDAVHRQYPRAPILITENGTWSHAGRHGPASEGGTEEWQADKLRRHWRQVAARTGFVAGYTFWVLRDYKQRLNYNHDLNGISAMGLMTFDGRRRLAYDAFRDARTPRPGTT